MQRRPEESNGKPAEVPGIDDLVDCHSEKLYRVAYRLTGRTDVAEDLVQETFLDAFRGMAQLRSVDSSFAWLVAILRRRRVKWLKEQSREPIPMPEVDLAAPVPDAPLEIDEEALAAALDRLPDEYREPLVLFYFEDLKYREIAEALETPIGTVMSRLARAKAALRSLLETTGKVAVGREVRDGSP